MRLNPVLLRFPEYPTTATAALRSQLRAAGRPVFDFSIGDAVEAVPSFVQAAMIQTIPDACTYPTTRGLPAVREAFAGYVARRLGVPLDPDTQVLPTAGTKEAIFHLPFLVIDPAARDRAVLFPDPGYPVYARAAALAGGEPLPVPLPEDGVLRLWELPSAILQQVRLVWVNTPHNPTGGVMSHEDLRRTWEICQAHDILLASDESYIDVYDDHPPTSLLQVAGRGVLTFHSLSKRNGLTGLRSGVVAGDPEVIARFRHLRDNPGLAPQDFVNAAAAAAWSEDGHAAIRREAVSSKRALLRGFLDDIGVSYVGGGAGMYLWVRAPSPWNGESYTRRLLDAGIVATPGRAFALTDVADGWFRLALTPSLSECAAAIEAWKKVL